MDAGPSHKRFKRGRSAEEEDDDNAEAIGMLNSGPLQSHIKEVVKLGSSFYSCTAECSGVARLSEQKLSKVKELMTTSINLPWTKSEGASKFFSDLSQILDNDTLDAVETNVRNCTDVKKAHALNIVDGIRQKILKSAGSSKNKVLKRLKRSVLGFDFVEARLNYMREKLFKKRIPALRLLVDQVMSNHLLASKIFGLLPNQDLLNCSLACKVWHEQARRVLRQDKKSYIIINERNPCRKLAKLKLILKKKQQNGSIFPYNGLQIGYDCSYNCQNYVDDDDDPFYLNSNNNNMVLKNLKICHWNMNQGCPAFHLLRHLFSSENYTTDLEEILIFVAEIGRKRINQILNVLRNRIPPPPTPPSPIPDDLSLPKLQCLILQTSPLNNDLPFLNAVIRAAPNLAKIDGNVVPGLIDSIVDEKKSHLVTSFQIDVFDAPAIQSISKFVKENPQLRKICLSYQGYDFTQVDVDVQQVLKLLLEGSANVLKNMEVSQSKLVSLFCGPPEITAGPLPCLTQMQLFHRHLFDDQTWNFSSLSKIDWLSKFPNLNFIFVANSMSDPKFSLQVIGRVREQPTYSSCTATRLQIDGKYYKDGQLVELIERLAPIFPNITHLHLQECVHFREVLSSRILWTAWSLLESLSFTNIKDGVIWRNMDSIFTGIEDPHCHLLRETGDYGDYKQFKVHSSISDLKRLKLLRLHIYHEGHKCENELESTKDIFLTKVTTKCAFEVMEDPEFMVEISREPCHSRKCHLALNCLHPHVTFSAYSLDGPKEWRLHDDDISNDEHY